MIQRALIKLYHKTVRLLDREQVQAFQGMYYVIFVLGALVLMFVPGADIGPVDDMLGPTSYQAWLIMNLICPPLTLIGRRLTTLAVRKAPNEPNSAWGAAWLQFTGDLGVWLGVNIFVYEMFRFSAAWWLYNVYFTIFMLMGILGGSMFTFRSSRRLIEIKRAVRRDRRLGL